MSEIREATFDRDGYPTDETLLALSTWEISRDYNASLASFLSCFEGAWNLNYGTWRRRGNVVIVATGGWSGNEDVIRAVESNLMFMALCWKKSERGGRYTFEIPVIVGT